MLLSCTGTIVWKLALGDSCWKSWMSGCLIGVVVWTGSTVVKVNAIEK